MLLAGLAVLTLLAVAALTRPWWRPLTSHAPARRAANVAAYRSRLGEIDRDVASGQIPAESAEQLQRETATQLLGDTEGMADDDHPVAATGTRWIGAALAVAVMLFAGLWYWQSGSWQVQQQVASAPAVKADEPPPPPEVQAMVERLDAKLKADPNDAEGWAMLGRSYFVLHHYLQSATAFHEANARNGGQVPAVLAGEGEALAFANGSDVPPEASALFDRALAADADNGPALWYGGLADAQTGNFTRARQRWTRLEQQTLPPEMKALVDREMAALATTAGSAPMATATANDTPNDGPAVAAPAAPAVSGVNLHLIVRLAPALAAKVPKGATLFVFAKADGGSPMPLAVVRQPVAGWPLNLTLDDSMAMAPTMRLSSFDRYVVTARISASGQAQAQAGDLQGTLKLTRAQAAQPADLVIDEIAP